MPTDSTISSYSALTGANLADGDEFEVVDISDTSLAPTGTNKSMTATELANGMRIKGVAAGGSGSGPTIANTETVLCSYSIAANELKVGTTFAFAAYLLRAGATSAAEVWRVRIGPTTLTGNIVAALTPPVSTLAVGYACDGLAVCRATGAAGTMTGSIKRQVHLAAVTIQPALAFTGGGGTVAVDTTVANLIELTFISGNASNSFDVYSAAIYKVVS